MNTNQRILLTLVRLAQTTIQTPCVLSNRDVDLYSSIEWEQLMNTALAQGVGAVAFSAIDRLPANVHPARSILMRWIGRIMMMEKTYEEHKSQIASLATFYAKYGIRMLLLKGYGCGLCWPQQGHRPTGDIDVYLFGKHEDADRLVERKLGIKVHREYHKHSTFSYHGVEVENHAKFIDDVSHKSNIRFEQTLMSLLCREDCIESPINNVLLPPPTFNALFLLRHTGEHFASNEITLRHVLDVGMFFSKYHSLIDWKIVMTVYQRERMADFFNGIATICVEYLGMRADCFGATDKSYSYHHDTELAKRILADIFEQKTSLPMSTKRINTITKKLRYGISKSVRWWHNRWKYRLVYNENLVESFWWLAINRIK